MSGFSGAVGPSQLMFQRVLLVESLELGVSCIVLLTFAWILERKAPWTVSKSESWEASQIQASAIHYKIDDVSFFWSLSFLFGLKDKQMWEFLSQGNNATMHLNSQNPLSDFNIQSLRLSNSTLTKAAFHQACLKWSWQSLYTNPHNVHQPRHALNKYLLNFILQYTVVYLCWHMSHEHDQNLSFLTAWVPSQTEIFGSVRTKLFPRSFFSLWWLLKEAEQLSLLPPLTAMFVQLSPK